ncbi:DUF1819 family protein [Companilactobacillus paralimentarius]|uniref:DUF1819 family protein n=1 Tax=Companilactobacillus paralimentarius TaxID=83526 RepID=UPI00384B6070
MKKYSAGMVSHSFWQDEFSQYIDLVNEGLSADEIKYKSIEENYFHQSSKARSKDLNNVLKRRVTKLNQDYIKLYPSLQLADKELVNLMSIMKLNSLFEEFMYETYRDELIVGDAKLYDYEVESFFSRKQQENAQVANWTDQTITRLTGIFKTFIREAGLMKDHGEYDDVIRPFMDYRLENLMRINKDNRILSIFLGR